ncbi:hypothetical protein N7470_005947 [Penicillium chermesinum]|nr:hypothetical protein N7470_005947 [Penicillium chermesinum]
MVAPRNTAYAEESAEVEVLYANLEKLNRLTKKIQGSLVRLETSGQVVKEAIGPIYSNTQSLQITNTNIDKVNEAIDRLRQPLDAKNREEDILRADPQNAGLSQYIAAMKRVEKALVDLNTTNLKSNQRAIADFNSLLGLGSSKLQELFRSELMQHVNKIEPLYYLTKDIPFPTIPDEKDCRTCASLLRYYLGMGSQPPTQQGESSIENIRRVPWAIHNCMLAKLGVGLPEHYEEKAYRRTQGLALQATFLSPMAEYSKTLRELNTYIRQNLMTDCFLAFEIIEIVTDMSYRIDTKAAELKTLLIEALRPVRETAKSSLSELLEETKRKTAVVPLPPDGGSVPLVEEVMSSLATLTGYSGPLASILTSLGDGNWRSKSSTAGTAPLDVGPDSGTLLSHFILDMIEALMTGLEAHGRASHRSKATLGVFLSNVFFIVDRSIRQHSELAQYLGAPDSIARIDTFRKRASSTYLDAWKETSQYLLDVQYTSRTGARPNSGGAVDSSAIVKSLSSKDRDAIKEKFKSFNASFDAMVSQHKTLHMEREVRSVLSRELQAVLEPLYARFYDRYVEIDKGRGKYIKYDKNNLAVQLAQLS